LNGYLHKNTENVKKKRQNLNDNVAHDHKKLRFVTEYFNLSRSKMELNRCAPALTDYFVHEFEHDLDGLLFDYRNSYRCSTEIVRKSRYDIIQI